MPRVSVIIIVRNGERYIGEAIESIICQTGNAWELIVVDDGSSDGTEAVVRSMAAAIPGPLKLLHHPGRANLGMSASRNLGLASASGEYVAFLDADDVWLPRKLVEQTAILDAEPGTAMVYGRTLIWYSWDSAARKQDRFYDLGVKTDATYFPSELFRQLITNRFQSPTTCNAMTRRSALLAVGGFDPSFRDMFEDQLVFAKLLLRFPAHVSSQCWAKYRQHEQATSAVLKNPTAVDRAHLRYLVAVYRYARWTRSASCANVAALAARAIRLALRIGKRRLRRWLRLDRAQAPTG